MKTQVIIAGAGPVGLFLAAELALANCSVLVLEKAADPHSPLKRLPFGIRGLNAPSIEALRRRGLLDQMAVPKRLKNPFGKPSSPQAGHFAGIPFHYDDIDIDLPPGSTHLLAEMAELEAVLTRHAEALGVTIRRGAAITGVQQAEHAVTVDAGGQSFEAPWLVGCDGARSVVRKAAGIAFVGTEPEFTGYSAQVELADPTQLRPGRIVTPTGMYFQSQPGYLAIQDFDGGAFHGSGVTLTKLHLATTWTDRARQATQYRNGRILLAGDAAHIHAPLGGQGLNLGIGDAANLGWKLAATIHHTAPPGLLDSYHDERHPIGERVLDWSRAQAAIMRPTPEARALHAIFRDLMRTRDGATYFASRVWGIQDTLAAAHVKQG